MPDKNKLIFGTNDDTYIAADSSGNIVLQHEEGQREALTSSAIEPATDETLDLGSATNKFKDLYLSSDSIFIGNTKLSSDPTTGALATAVADGQGGFSAATAVGPSNVDEGTTMGARYSGATSGGFGMFQIFEYTDNKIEATGNLLNLGNDYSFLDINQEFTWAGKGCKMSEMYGYSLGPDGFAEGTNPNNKWDVDFIVLPGNEDVDVSVYGNLHSTMSAANYKWKLVEAQFGGDVVLQLIDNDGVAQDWANTYVVAVGTFNGGSLQTIPGGIKMADIFDKWAYSMAGFYADALASYGHPNDISWEVEQSTFELTNGAAFIVTIGGIQYKLMRSTDGSGTALLGQV